LADLLKSGAAWLADQRKAQMAHAVTYRRGEQEITVQATVGKTDFSTDDQQGRTLEFESRDYLITAADLAALAGGAEPQEGDEITEDLETGTETYRVMLISGAPAFRYSDQSRKTIRIHTKHVGS